MSRVTVAKPGDSWNLSHSTPAISLHGRALDLGLCIIPNTSTTLGEVQVKGLSTLQKSIELL